MRVGRVSKRAERQEHPCARAGEWDWGEVVRVCRVGWGRVAYLSCQPRALDAVHRDLQVYLAEGLVEDRCNAIPVDPFEPFGMEARY